ncbi:60S ribosomal protein L28 [Frankliniella fusca]|uniref:Large ribosomal subunit protein eL28 n=1 Tax=Frankliniella fusca TaxID=407009 RepID=A0AAE1LJ17_9NEOP|nr:60S ribosomal protein L28 [Frankliniella fusca]
MTSHLSWMIVRNNSAFLLKKRNVSKPFSTEPNNLLNLNSYRYNGLVHKKSVGIVPAADKKGFTVVYKKAKASHKPAKATIKRTMKSGPRRSLTKLRRLIHANHYRRDLLKAALRRASAVLKSQKKPVTSRKARAKKTE